MSEENLYGTYSPLITDNYNRPEAWVVVNLMPCLQVAK